MKRTAISILHTLFFAALVSNVSYAQTTGNDPYKGYSHYEIKATLDVANRKLIGSETVRFINTFSEPVDSLYFFASNWLQEKNPYLTGFANDLGFVNGFEPSSTEIKKVTDIGGVPLEYRFIPLTNYLRIWKYSVNRYLFYVKLNTPLAPGEEALVKIDFEVNVPNVHAGQPANNYPSERWYYKNIFLLRYGWYPLEVHRKGNNWDLEIFAFPGHFVDKLELSVPKDYVAAVAGDKVVETTNGEIKTITAMDDNPVAAKALAISPHYRVISSNTADGVQVNVYYLPETEKSQAQYILQSCVEIVEKYNQLYGKRDYAKIDIVNTPFKGTSSKESDGMIQLGDLNFSTANILVPRLSERQYYQTCAHELAHLWAGDNPLVDVNKENYLSEGLADLMSYNLVEEKFPGTGNAYKTDPFNIFGYLLFLTDTSTRYTFRDENYGDYINYYKDRWDEPLIAGLENSTLNTLETKHYKKGHRVFKMLETYVGKEVMLESLREYFATYKHKVATTEDLKAILERKSGKNPDRFFDDWLYGAEYADYSIKRVKNTFNEGKYNTEIEIGKKGKGLTPLEVEVVLEGGEKQRVFLEEVTTDTTVTVSTEKKVKGVSLDPEANILETTRLNNKNIDNLDFYLFGNVNQLIHRRPLENYFLGLYPSLYSKEIGGKTEQGIGLKLVGQDNLNHRWQLGGTPIFDTADGFQYSSYRAFGGVSFFRGRGKTISLDAAYDSRKKLDTGLSFSLPLYKIVDAGFYGRFYYPSYTLDLTFLREDSLLIDSPLHSVAVGLSYNWLLKYGFTGNINLEGSAKIADFNDYQFVKVDAGFTKFFRLAPRLLLVPSIQLGGGDNLPYARRYKLQDGLMRGYKRREEGDRFADLSLDLTFPIMFGKKQKLLNLAVFRGIAGGVFLEAGDVWDSNAEVIKANTFLDDAKINAGIEFSFLFTSIGDNAFPLSFGYGHNLWSAKEKGMVDSGRFYFKFDTPVTLFTTLFGY